MTKERLLEIIVTELIEKEKEALTNAGTKAVVGDKDNGFQHVGFAAGIQYAINTIYKHSANIRDSYRYFPWENNETGINCRLNTDQLKRIFAIMQGQYLKSTEIDFVSALTPDPLPRTFKRVKWIDKARKTGQSNKSTLRAFLTAVKGGKTVTRSDAQKFADKAGKTIILNKPRPGRVQDNNVEMFNAVINNAL